MTATHIKLTAHFLDQARDRMPREDVLQLWDLMLTGDLTACAEKLNGDNGAVSLGKTWVVFCIDERDSQVLALKTALRANQSEVIARRNDTRVLRLPKITPRCVDSHGLSVRQTMVGVELSTPDDEITLGLTDDEAQELHEALGIVLAPS